MGHIWKEYYIDVIKQSAWLELHPSTAEHVAYLFNCKPVGRGLECLMAPI